ncbi:MAG: response regulator [Acidimicrobiales bacterium]|nr:response regulator [Acidimicrobiales bacterium]MCB1250924.1 response regulator [Acidimicrobiales bacterium]MCB1258844.1 response regulator [Acidimicrobiales bacterium]
MRKIFSKHQTEDPAVLEHEIEVVQAVRAHSTTGKDILFGTPTRCPQCGDFGLVDDVDAAQGRCSLHCPGCLAEWVITRRALKAAGPMEVQPTVEPAPEAPDAGSESASIDLPPIHVPGPPPDLRLLLIEDDPADASLLRTILAPYAAERVRLIHVTTRAAGEKLVADRGPFDVVLMDLGLPDSAGVNTITAWRATGDMTPIVVLSGNDLPDLDSLTRRLGAASFIHKRDLVQIAAADGRGSDRLVAQLRSVAAPKH